MCDDLFDDDVSEIKTGELLWLKNSKNLHLEGYREGLDAGQESTLQDGFNGGFTLATSLLFNIAELRGEIRNSVRVLNGLDPDQARHFVGPDLGTDCLQRLSADDTSSGILSLNLLRGGTLDATTESKLQDLLGDVVVYETEMFKYDKQTLQSCKGQIVDGDEDFNQHEQNIKKPVDASGNLIIKENEYEGLTSIGNSGNIDNETDLESPDKSLTSTVNTRDSDKEMQTLPNQGFNEDSSESRKTSDVKIHAEGNSFVHSKELGDTRLNQYRERLKELVNP